MHLIVLLLFIVVEDLFLLAIVQLLALSFFQIIVLLAFSLLAFHLFAVHHFLLLLLEQLNIFLSQFSYVLAVLPDSHAWCTIALGSEHASAVLLSIEPLAGVDLAVGPLESSLTMLDVVNEVTFILSTVGPD